MRHGHLFLPALVAASLIVPFTAHAQYVFYTDTNAPQPSIRRCGPTGADSTSRPLPAYSMPEGLAYDPFGNRLYWVEAAYSGARIRTCSASFQGMTTILSGLGSVRGIVIDPGNGWLYWSSSDQATGARIERAHLDGSGRQTLFVLPGNDPRQLAIDPVEGKLYWTEFEQDAIMRCNLDGSQGEVLGFLGAGSRPYGVAVQPSRRELWLTLYGPDLVGYVQIPVSPAPASARSSDPPTDAPQDVESRSAALIAALKERSTPLAPTGVATAIVDPTHIAIDLTGNRLFVNQAGVGFTAIQSIDLTNGIGFTLPVVQTTFGGVAWYGNSLVDVPGDDPVPAPVAFALHAPNPARGGMTLEFGLPAEADVSLDVMDLAGRRVASLAEGRHSAGKHRVTWTGETGSGRAAPGMYLVRLQSAGRQITRRFAYLQ